MSQFFMVNQRRFWSALYLEDVYQGNGQPQFGQLRPEEPPELVEGVLEGINEGLNSGEVVDAEE